MKKTNLAAMGATMFAAATLLPACSSDDNAAKTNYPKDNVVRVTANVSDMATRGSHTTASLADMGLSIKNPGNATYSYGNVKLTKGEASWSPASLMLWQNSTQAVDIVAYAPYKDGYASPSGKTTLCDVSDFPVAVQTEQTAGDNSSDFLVYKVAGFNPGEDLNSNGAVPVSFTHALSQLTITVRFGTEFDEAERLSASPISEILVGGTKTGAAYDFTADIAGAAITATGAAADVKPYESAAFVPASGDRGREVSNATATYACILIPQVVEAGKFTVSFSANGKTYSWTSPAAVTLAAGSAHTLELNVGRDVVVPGSFSVKLWDNGGTTSLATD